MTTELIEKPESNIGAALVIAQPLPDVSILAGQVAASSARTYRRDFAAYVSFAETKDSTLDPITLARWRAHLAANTAYSPKTINRMLAAVKRLMKEAGQQGYIASDIAAAFQDVPGVREVALKDRLKKNARTKLSPAQMRMICDAPDRATLIGKRDAALLATMASSGARISEIVSLTAGQLVPRGRGWLINIQGKNDVESRDAPLSREAHQLIVAWLQSRPIQSPYIFTSWAGRGDRPTALPMTEAAAWRVVQKYAAQVGISNVKPHDFRRFVGT
jgi:integrase